MSKVSTSGELIPGAQALHATIIFHVITPDATTTLLDRDALLKHVSGFSRAYLDTSVVIVVSAVSGAEYEKLLRMTEERDAR